MAIRTLVRREKSPRFCGTCTHCPRHPPETTPQKGTAPMLDQISLALTRASLALPSAVPDPGDGSMPPGFEKFIDVMGWAKWLALGALVLALIAAGVMMSVNQRRGEGGEDAGRIMKVVLGAMIVSAAVSIIGFLVA